MDGSQAQAGQARGSGSIAKLAASAVGIVFGDIGTSPIYAFRETFAGHHPLTVDALHIFGVLSLIFWSMMIIVTLKYVTIIMRADNKGEGGSMALLALLSRQQGDGRKRWTAGIVLLGIFATALFYGDSMITPAISVLSAVEGLTTLQPGLEPFVIPAAVTILVGLFMLQRRGTAKVGALFAPIMIFYFCVLAGLGIGHIANYPSVVLATLNPLNALQLFWLEPWSAFVAMGSVVLAVTGAEALYADMGHFGRAPIRASWIWFVMPALLLNYMGQGAMILAASSGDAAELIRNPFFFLASEAWRLPLVILATLATIIASQAVISGAFSVTQQAIQLGFIPRLRIMHTSPDAAGQIYIPAVNWALMVMVILLVVSFGSSSNLAAAYGIAVTGAMAIDTILIAVVLFGLWKWSRWLSGLLIAIFIIVDLLYFGANLLKVPYGGWFPLVVGVVAFTLLTTWGRGRTLLIESMDEASLPMNAFIGSAVKRATRVSGTAVFMTKQAVGTPHALLHNLKHNKVIHERVVLLTVQIGDVPFVRSKNRVETQDLGSGFYRVILRYGFMEDANVPATLFRSKVGKQRFKEMETSFFLGRQKIVRASRPVMARWREILFAWMLRNSESAMEFFRLPSNRVVELGSQIEL